MRTLISLSMLFAVTVAGCSSDSPAGDDDVPGDDDPMGPGEQPVPLTPEGTFAVKSQFDLATNIPGKAGTVTTYFIQATDDPEDPTLFIVQKITEALPAGTIRDKIEQFTPLVAGYLNTKLLEIAPTFVTKVVDLGDAFGQVAKGFGTLETLEVSGEGAAVKTVRGLHFKIDELEHEIAFADHGIAETRVTGLTVELEPNGKLDFSEHKVPLKFGQIAKLALDQVIIPMIDPSAANLTELLQNSVNCTKVGAFVFEKIQIGSASTFESACENGLKAGAGALYTLMDSVDTSALEFGLTGVARGVDKNRDGKMDEIVTGAWNGDIQYAGTPAPLSTAKFFGARK